MWQHVRMSSSLVSPHSLPPSLPPLLPPSPPPSPFLPPSLLPSLPPSLPPLPPPPPFLPSRSGDVEKAVEWLELYVDISESAGLKLPLMQACKATGILHNTLVCTYVCCLYPTVCVCVPDFCILSQSHPSLLSSLSPG